MEQKTILATIFVWVTSKAENSIKAPELFDKEEKLDKLVIKNQIAYHFKKVVREVSQELFVSRRIDVSLLFAGIQVLKRTENEVRKACDDLPNKRLAKSKATPTVVETRVVHVDTDGRDLRKTPFYVIDTPTYASFKESKARCIALGLQLPEIYTANQMNLLSDFLRQNNIAQCFAGIEPDMSDAIPRHIAIQYPIWKTAYTEIYDCTAKNNPAAIDITYTLDDGHAKYYYTSDKKLCTTRDVEGNPIFHRHYAYPEWREKQKVLSQRISRIVCAQKWDGRTDIDLPQDNFNRGGLTIKSYASRKRREARLRKLRLRREAKSPNADLANVQAFCVGVADQAKESYEDMQSKLKDLLSLVDITVHSEILDFNRQRRKRVIPLFLLKFIFVTGVKVLWQLFGFVQKVKMNKRLKNIESMLQVTNERSIQNSDAISNMTKLIYGNSLAIGQLNVRVDGLEARLNLVETQLGALQQDFTGLSYRFETVAALNTIDNLIIRIRKSMDSGYDILKDIIHCSKLKQTSPLVLPLDQIDLVQAEISKVSTAQLDPDFSKMQSIVVSDPTDPSMLLIVVNVAALSRRNLELVKMIPVPYFEGNEAYEISLDYHTVVLDQSTHTFSILTEQEEYSCLFNRCYVGSSEQSLLERSCGIPQFYDRHKDACMSSNVVSSGVFLQPMLPDGVLFALRDEVQSQIFCKEERVGKTRNLKGTGILQLPNGCTLSVIDKDGRVYKIKGQPLYTMITAGDLELMPNGPLSAVYNEVDTNGTRKVASIDTFVDEKVSSVLKQVETVDGKMSEQHTHVWALTGIISLSFILIMIVVYLFYQYSTRARRKIRDIRGNFKELTHKILDREVNSPVPVGFNDVEGGPVVPPPQRRRDVWLRHLKEQRAIARALRQSRQQAELEVQDRSLENRPNRAATSYVCLNELSNVDVDERYVSRPLSRPSAFVSLTGLTNQPREYPKEYPRIPTPLVKEAKDYELERLREETEMVRELEQVISSRSVSKDSDAQSKTEI